MEDRAAHSVTASVPLGAGGGSASLTGAARFRAPPALVRKLSALVAVGLATILAGSLLAPERTAASLLVAAYYVLSLGLAGTLLIAIEYLTGASWSIAIRRLPESMAGTLPAGAFLFLLALAASHRLYPWFGTAHASSGETAWFRDAWLTPWFFYLRSAIYLAAWLFLASRIVGHSRQQDCDGDIAHTRANVRWSAAFLVVFGLTLWLATTDWIMSLEPHWYSTIFGVYHFAGLIVGGLAMTAIMAIWLERLGPLRGILTPEHLHDLGKLIFAFSTFWMYIWFSQYMLIWYANIPEEAVYFTRRLEGAWEPVFYLNVLLNWAVPFVSLLSARAKRRPGVLLKVCWILLAGRWVDLWWMVMPPFSEGKPAFGVWEVGVMAGAAGVFFLAQFRSLASVPTIPVRDPYLWRSLRYRN